MTEARHSVPTAPEPSHKWRDFRVLVVALLALAVVAVPVGWLVKTKVDAWVGRPDSHAHVSVAAATTAPQCTGMPVSGANVLKYRASGRVSTKGEVPKGHWLLSTFPNPELAKKRLYQWTLSPWQLQDTSYAVYLLDGACRLEPLRPSESKTTFRLDGRPVPGTDVSFQLPPKAALQYVVLSSKTIDPHAAN